MRVTKATLSDIDQVMAIYAMAVRYMQENGNPTQWQGGYPFREIVEEDISLGRLYLLRNDNSEIIAQFCFYIGDDPTYAYIDGQWLNDNSYGVVHRIASSGKTRSVAKICLDWCFSEHPNIRIDTHSDNHKMQQTLRESGYVECGEIIVYNGTRRVAFQRTK
ncbi:MAG: GNAT family N-acetyltransferase [Rikenellaceae bacterium]